MVMRSTVTEPRCPARGARLRTSAELERLHMALAIVPDFLCARDNPGHRTTSANDRRGLLTCAMD
jgi:hypothetical protein